MVRRYGEPIEVRVDPDRGAPRSFLWRDRIYLVREVLDHWQERQAWWATPAARAVHGDDVPSVPAAPVPAASATGAFPGAPRRPAERSAAPEVAPETATATRSALGTEREIWRVEARRGRSGASGVFDLCHDLVLARPGRAPDAPPTAATVPAGRVPVTAGLSVAADTPGAPGPADRGPVPAAVASVRVADDLGQWLLVRVGD